MSVNDVIKVILLPLIMLLSLVVFVIVYHLLGLPSSFALIDLARNYLDLHGYPIVFAAALVETIPPINLYFPGSVVMVVAVAHSRTGSLNPFVVLFLIESAFIISYSLNYLVGKYGFHWILVRCGLGDLIERSKSKISEKGIFWLYLSLWHPNFGSITAVACGILLIPFHRFLVHIIFAVAAWNSLFGFVVFLGGDKVMRLLDLRWLAVMILIWLILLVIQMSKNSKTNNIRPKETEGN
jgi:membrane protein DedA with SNARE-associated domain